MIERERGREGGGIERERRRSLGREMEGEGEQE